jgi:hypothetical protein
VLKHDTTVLVDKMIRVVGEETARVQVDAAPSSDPTSEVEAAETTAPAPPPPPAPTQARGLNNKTVFGIVFSAAGVAVTF